MKMTAHYLKQTTSSVKRAGGSRAAFHLLKAERPSNRQQEKVAAVKTAKHVHGGKEFGDVHWIQT